MAALLLKEWQVYESQEEKQEEIPLEIYELETINFH